MGKSRGGGLHAVWTQDIRPGMTIVSWADFSAEWLVLSVATRVKDRHLEVEMQNGKRVLTRTVEPGDVVLKH